MPDLKNNMDKVFRDKLGNYRKDPPEEIWENISGSLGKRKLILLIPWRTIAAGIALLITTGSLYYLFNKPVEVASDFKGKVPDETSVPVIADNRNKEIAETKLPESDSKVKAAEKRNTASDVKLAGSSQIKNAENHTAASTDKEVYTKNINSETQVDKPENAEEKVIFTETYIASSGLNMTTEIPVILNPGEALYDKIPSVKRTSVNPDVLTSLYRYDEPDEKEKNIWSLSAQVSPTFTYRSLSYENKDVVNTYNDTESGKLSYSGGFQLGIKATDRISIYTGVMYSKTGTHITNIYTSYNEKNIITDAGKIRPVSNPVNLYFLSNSTGIIESAKSDKIISNSSYAGVTTSTDIAFFITSSPSFLKPEDHLNQYFQFLEIPLIVRYKVVDRKVKVNILGGVNTDVLVGNKVVLVSDGDMSVIGETNQIRTFNYAGNIGFGFDYDLTKNLLFTLEPQFKYYLNSINNSDLINNRPYSIGMFTGIKYIF